MNEAQIKHTVDRFRMNLYLRDLSEIGRKHGVALAGEPTAYFMERDDYLFDYSSGADGRVFLGSPGDSDGDAGAGTGRDSQGRLDSVVLAEIGAGVSDMQITDRALLLTVARVLRAKIRNEIYAEQADDLWALNEVLAPYDPLPGPAVNEANESPET